MQCPIDGAQLVMTERSGVEIDYCPQCRGVWLDRGELDKIIERGMAQAAPQPPTQVRSSQHSDDRGYRREADHGRSHPKRRESFLGDLFDF